MLGDGGHRCARIYFKFRSMTRIALNLMISRKKCHYASGTAIRDAPHPALYDGPFPDSKVNPAHQ